MKTRNTIYSLVSQQTREAMQNHAKQNEINESFSQHANRFNQVSNSLIFPAKKTTK